MICERCGGELQVGDFPFCKGNQKDHARGVSTVIGDDIDEWQVNGARHPIHFRSRLERERWRKENGYRVYDTHVGEQGSDKSKFTRTANMTDPQTLENGRYLVTHRQMIDAADPPDPPLNITWREGTLTKAEARAYRKRNERRERMAS